MRKYYTGSDRYLRRMGFLQNFDSAYWFYPGLDKMHFLFIDAKDHSVEYCGEKSLKLIEGFIEER